jgi:predicted Rossmann fold flavoprotein
MKRFASGSGSTISTGVRVKGFILEDGVIKGVKTTEGNIHADTFVLATGGVSHKVTGASGEGVLWLKKLGHTTHDPNPDIVPLKVEEKWVKKLSGTSLSFMKITFGVDRAKKAGRFSRVGKILFTHFGISGPLILNSAHEVKKLLTDGPVNAVIDMYPDTELGTLRNRILELFNINKNKMLKNILSEIVPDGMSDTVLSLLPQELSERKVHSVGKSERHALADILKAIPLTVTGTMGYDWAVVSDGGVDLTEVDTKTMRSKIYKNLFLTGDVLHISRPSGGYSLQLCWTTGWVAGNSV